MNGSRFFHSISLENLLSYNGKHTLQLEPLNVLIGGNGTGKSNLIECFRLLNSLPIDLTAPFLNSGGVREWFNKKNPDQLAVEAVVDLIPAIQQIANHNQIGRKPSIKEKPNPSIETPLVKYKLKLTHDGILPQITSETVSDAYWGNVYSWTSGEQPIIRSIKFAQNSWDILENSLEQLDSAQFTREQSILKQIKDPSRYLILSLLQTAFSSIRLYTDFSFGRSRGFRLSSSRFTPRFDGLSSAQLDSNLSNLSFVLYRLQDDQEAFAKLVEAFKQFLPSVDKLVIEWNQDAVQLSVIEVSGVKTPSTRLSDGTLRFLALLTVLYHPAPPPLVCIEEPELGMHPDIIPIIADLLIEASQRTQIVVTTHSTMLVSAVGETCPEAVIVCERNDDGTQMRRLDKEQLAPWLERYTLGDLWMKGEIGGTRW